ncbi:N-acetyltransferase [Agromyces sp. G08B096]|uniref:N-acetyltransferase n=1 Tax=Agromyces sp. G08B096 TaxID=3156399 RepID=A0AAU7W5C6_9MICO
MSDLLIRAADPADVPALADLAAETFPLACPPHTTPEAVADFIARTFQPAHFEGYLADPDRAVLVAVDAEGTLVGYAMLVSGEPADADAAAAVTARPAIELSKFYTRRATHGAGVAAPLMTAALDVAAATGAAVCWLGVNEENERAIRFYRKRGFEVVGRKHFTVGDRVEDDFVLERPLA